MTNCTRRVSQKILDHVYDAILSRQDELGVCRATTTDLCTLTDISRVSIEAALTELERAGRIDRQTWLAAHNVKRRDIRTFPRAYNVGRKLLFCANRAEYLYLRAAFMRRQ